MTDIPTPAKKQEPTDRAAPNWRDVFAQALHDARNNPAEYGADYMGPAREGYRELGDAILAAIAERGYRLHRDHAWPNYGSPCSRCGAIYGGFLAGMSCEGGPSGQREADPS